MVVATPGRTVGMSSRMVCSGAGPMLATVGLGFPVVTLGPVDGSFPVDFVVVLGCLTLCLLSHFLADGTDLYLDQPCILPECFACCYWELLYLPVKH